jgi:hypothetical protein
MGLWQEVYATLRSVSRALAPRFPAFLSRAINFSRAQTTSPSRGIRLSRFDD